MKSIIRLMAVFAAVLFVAACTPVSQAVSEDGEIVFGPPITGDRYEIVIPDRATTSERTAAMELSLYLGKVTGERLLVVEESNHSADRKGLFVGKCEYTQKTGRVDYDKLGLEGLHIFATDDGNLVLTGDRRGVLYAVYEFLERYAGCRWFAEECFVIPQLDELRMPMVDYSYIPPLEYRDIDYKCIYSEPRLVVANRLNGFFVHRCIKSEWGGAYHYKGFVHTFNQLVPPEVYGKDHPEYFSEINGKRVTKGRTQLCLTNPDVLKIVTAEVRRRFRDSPDAIVSISQNDWRFYCECKNCSELAEKEGSQSGPLIHFVNAVARAVRKDFPNSIVDTLAYTYTRKPPKYVKAEPNVVIRLCTIECCFAHSFESDPFNASFLKDLKEWERCCSRLHIWDYVINYRCMMAPYPNFHTIGPNLRYLTKHSVTGIYEEANYLCRGGELEHLRAYITARIMWDPEYDVEKGIVEFTDAYYGKAAPMIRQYLDMMREHVLAHPERHMRIWSKPNDYLDKDVLDKAMEIFKQAEAAVADDPVRLNRVEMALTSILYARLYCRMDDPETRAAMLDRFEKIARRVPDKLLVSESKTATLDNFIKSVKKSLPQK